MKKLLQAHRQIFLFLIAGGLSVMLEIWLFHLLSRGLPAIVPAEANWWGIHYPLSNILSTTVAIVFNYFLSIWFVFETGKHSRKREFTYFMILSGITTLLSLLIFQAFYRFVFTKSMDFKLMTVTSETLSKLASIVLVSAANFLLKKRVIFNG